VNSYLNAYTVFPLQGGLKKLAKGEKSKLVTFQFYVCIIGQVVAIYSINITINLLLILRMLLCESQSEGLFYSFVYASYV